MIVLWGVIKERTPAVEDQIADLESRISVLEHQIDILIRRFGDVSFERRWWMKIW